MISYPITKDQNKPPHTSSAWETEVGSTSPLRLDLTPWYTSGFE